MTEKPDQRCPHDGGYCHHNCETECRRKKYGFALSSPWKGFPRQTNAPIVETMPNLPRKS